MNDRKCTKCGEIKNLDLYPLRYDLKVSPAHYTICKTCMSKQNAERHVKNKARNNASVKARYDTFGRFNRYGITEEKYENTLKLQGNSCALCGIKEPGGKGKWHIDHVHNETYKRNVFKQSDERGFRGLLCHNCNISLGHYEKIIDKVGVEKINKYLNR